MNQKDQSEIYICYSFTFDTCERTSGKIALGCKAALGKNSKTVLAHDTKSDICDVCGKFEWNW